MVVDNELIMGLASVLTAGGLLGFILGHRSGKKSRGRVPRIVVIDHAKGQVRDDTKRKSLQPGSTIQDKQKEEIVVKPRVPLKEEIQRKKETPKVTQPGVKQTGQAEAWERNLEGRYFSHKFFGSQLIVGKITVIKGLSSIQHSLEIEGNQLFIDNMPHAINPHDLQRIRVELAKVQGKK
jgi:hypothetical protein